MNNHNPNERIYLRPSKPVNEMTKDEIRALAEDTYEQIIRAFAEKKHQNKIDDLRLKNWR